MIPQETLRDWNCIDVKTGEPQTLTPFIERGFQELVMALLSWVRGYNLNNPNDARAVGYREEAGEGYTTFEFYPHNDMEAKRTVGSQTFHHAKVICFDQDHTKIRVRYTIWREIVDRDDILVRRTVKQLLDLVEVDYSLNSHPGMDDRRRAAADMWNHFCHGTFVFDNYREQKREEPEIRGEFGFKLMPTVRLKHSEH